MRCQNLALKASGNRGAVRDALKEPQLHLLIFNFSGFITLAGAQSQLKSNLAKITRPKGTTRKKIAENA